MPHIVIEYSDNLHKAVKDSGLAKAVYQAVLESELFSPEAIKARTISYSDYILPAGAKNFTHITVSIFAGRTTGQRAYLSNDVFGAARQCLPECEKLSVDIREMDGECYRK